MKKQLVVFFVIFFISALLSAQVLTPPFDENGQTETEESKAGNFVLLQNRFGGITITGYNGTEKNIAIPETIGGLPVTIIGNKAFYRRDIFSVAIPETVVTIEPLAFAENQLQSVDISGCVSIGYEAFAGNQLNSLTLSAQLSSIGPRAFINNNLSAINLPERITNIGKDAFTGNPLSAITVGASRNLFATQGFEPSFVNYYISLGRSAGVYVKDGRVWSLQEEKEK